MADALELSRHELRILASQLARELADALEDPPYGTQPQDFVDSAIRIERLLVEATMVQWPDAQGRQGRRWPAPGRSAVAVEPAMTAAEADALIRKVKA